MPKRPSQQEKTDRERVGKPGRGQDEIGKQGRGQDEIEPQRGKGRKGGADVPKPTTEETEFESWKEDQDLEEEPQVE